jgi:hypothetical protein
MMEKLATSSASAIRAEEEDDVVVADNETERKNPELYFREEIGRCEAAQLFSSEVKRLHSPLRAQVL